MVLVNLLALLLFSPFLPQASDQEALPGEPRMPYDTGPMKAEVTAMFDARYWYADEQQGARPSELRLQIRVAGDKITKVVRFGDMIFTEAVDSQGNVLLDPAKYTEEEKTQTRPLNLPPARLKETGLLLPGQMTSPARAAESIKLHGTVRLILAENKEEIAIDKPLQYVGKTLEHPRLKELGIEVRIIAPEALTVGEGEEVPEAKRTYVMEYVNGQPKIHAVRFHDAWMKPMRTRERPMQTKDEHAVIGHVIIGGELDENAQLVLDVYPEIQDLQVPLKADALPLP